MIRRLFSILMRARRQAVTASGRTAEELAVLEDFDTKYYLSRYQDVRDSGIDPVYHYMRFGWLEGRNPSAEFSTVGYLMANPDVLETGSNPFYHYVITGRAEGRAPGHWAASPNDYLASRVDHIVQNKTFPPEIEKAEALLVIVVPEHNTMSGGIYSFFSIAKYLYDMRLKHDYQILVATRPNKFDVTYLRQRNFRNSQDVFRFEQIVRCRKVKDLYLFIPEYATVDFLKYLDKDTIDYLRSRDKFYVNILNQKIDIMPEQDEFSDLREISHGISQSVAHHAYFTQDYADRYDLPTILLPAYTDLSAYASVGFEDKENLIIYSPDDSPFKEDVLEKLRKELPEYKLLEIRDIVFDKFMELATRCRFSITFGEGFDGYLAQPIYQGGVGFAVYNDDFFPSEDLVQFDNIFADGDDMIDSIVSKIRSLESSKGDYERVNARMMDLYRSLYSESDYKERLIKLVRREFEIFPKSAKGPYLAAPF